MAASVLKEIPINVLKNAPVKSQLKYYELLSNLREAEGSFKSALKAMQKFIVIKDSINDVLSNQTLERERNRLYYKSKEAEQKLQNELEKEQIIAQAEKERSSIMMVSMAFLFTTILGFTYYISSRKRSSLKKDIEVRKIMMKELQHRIKNHLQFVNNILFMEKSLKRGDTDFIERTSGKISTITKIYDQLLLGESSDLIPIQPYLMELVDDLLSLESEKPQLEVEILDLELPSDTVLALGLISNEVITNSLKYAFDSSSNNEATIKIRLQRKNKSLLFEISDNGRGFTLVKAQRSSGLYLIEVLAEQVNAKYTLDAENGVKHAFEFSA
ncbi:MAG: sensor histidine kinase [Ekhidna sp.]|nr:sensor histidine kinase [Ekhidna sp.]